MEGWDGVGGLREGVIRVVEWWLVCTTERDRDYKEERLREFC